MFKNIFNITKFVVKGKFKTIPAFNQMRPIQNQITFNFTSTSNPTQVALMEQVEAKVFQVLKSAAKCDQKKLTRASTFQQLGFDSLDSVQLVVAMEEYFGFDIPNEQAEKIQTVEAAINTFFRHLNSQVANKVVEKNEGDSAVQGDKK